MGNFTRDPKDCLNEALGRGAVALHVMESVRVGQGPLGGEIRRGVPVLDRDLTLMGDIAAERARSVIARFLGDGPLGGGFEIVPMDGNMYDFFIKAGSFLVGGVVYKNPSDINYAAQSYGPPTINTPVPVPVEGDEWSQTNTVYLDAWIGEVDETSDRELGNFTDVDVQTSVRRKAMWAVRVAEATEPEQLPSPPAGHTYVPLAIYEWNEQYSETGPIAVGSFEGNLARAQATLDKLVMDLQSFEDALSPVVHKVTPRAAYVGTDVNVYGDNLGLAVASQTLAGAPIPGLAATSVSKAVRVPKSGAGVIDLAITTAMGRVEEPIFVMSSATPQQAELVKVEGASGKDIAVMGRSAWIVGKDGDLLMWSEGRFIPLAGAPKAERVTVAPHDELWIVTPEHHIYRRAKGLWQRMPGLARDIGAGADGGVCKVGVRSAFGGHQLSRWSGRGWEDMSYGAERVTLGPEGGIYIVDADREILAYEGANWIAYGYDLVDVGIGVNRRRLYGANTAGDLKDIRLDDPDKDANITIFDPAPAPGSTPKTTKDFKWISVAMDVDDNVWAITQDGDVYVPHV